MFPVCFVKDVSGLYRRNTLPLGESQNRPSGFGEGETGDKVGVELFPAGLT